MSLKYLYLSDWIKKNIENGQFGAGSRIPTEEELAERFSYSRYTVRQAIAALEKEGLLYKIQGSGTYVSENVDEMIERRPDENESRVIGLIMVNNQAHVFPEVIRGISEYLTGQGYLLSISLTDNDFQKERQAIENLLAMKPAGIILEPAGSNLVPYNLDIYEKAARQVPMIMIHSAPTTVCPRLSLRGRKGARILMRYLLERGHSEIGAIYCLDEQTSQSRVAGMLDELYEHGLTPKDENLIWIRRNLADDLFRPGGSYILERMVKNVTAIMCHDDRIAYKVMQYLQDSGIRVPEDISVVGYDDVDILTATDIKITTIAHPKRAYGENAAKALLEYIRNPKNFRAEDYEIEPELVERSSVAERQRITAVLYQTDETIRQVENG